MFFQSPFIFYSLELVFSQPLENDGIVHRKIYEQVPPKVEYSLTDRGNSLNAILHQLCLWGESNIAERKSNGETINLLSEEQAS